MVKVGGIEQLRRIYWDTLFGFIYLSSYYELILCTRQRPCNNFIVIITWIFVILYIQNNFLSGNYKYRIPALIFLQP